ncbi:hypothetical protein EDD22DRAFT_849642 [Suillus occidentalis]|nr:hypothetical protein EDD22DRAFT_849642 [Suillus occidentalis]
MYQQPGQTGQWPIPDPPQHGQNPYPYPQSAVKRGKRKSADSDDAPPSKKRAIQLRGGSDLTQGLAHQTPAPPCYPATFSLVQTYHPHTQQELGEQTPGEESAVKRGKRKAVELDDAPPRQAIQHRVDGFMSAFYNIIPINGGISRGGSSNIGNSLDQPELAWAEQVKEFFDIIRKVANVASGELEVVNSR